MKKSLAVMVMACTLAGCSAAVTAETSGPEYAVVDARDAKSVDIPPGHMPPPGSCRIWYPGEPPGQQPPPGDCAELEREAPRGAWVLYRPNRERRVVRVR